MEKSKNEKRDSDYFPYKGYYDPEKGEYIPDCKKCYGEGWVCSISSEPFPDITPCECNPEELYPEE